MVQKLDMEQKVFNSHKVILAWNVKHYGKCMNSVVGFQFDGDNYDSLKHACEMCG